MAILPSNNQIVGAGLRSRGKDKPIPWQQEMKSAIRDIGVLCKTLELPDEFAGETGGTDAFPVFVPHSWIARIRTGDPQDPLLLQVLPVRSESDEIPGFTTDPLKESGFEGSPGILHKYEGRALLVANGACAIHCRYCFRRHFPYEQTPSGIDAWSESLDAIRKDPTIEEVILSGGDPLTLVDRTLHDLVRHISAIGHVSRLRIHTRLPVIIPSRITGSFLDLIGKTRLNTVMVIHSNHANELDDHVHEAITMVRDAGAILLNQSVLLKGVNDNAAALIALSKRLIHCGVIPYYLHQLDKVAGAAHFEVPVENGKTLIAKMKAALPGYAVPKYVQEIPGQPNKTVLA